MSKQRLTEATIKTLSTERNQEDIFHSLTPSGGLRLTREGNRTWFLIYRSPTAKGADGRGKLRRVTLAEHPTGRRGEGAYLTLKEFEAAYDAIRGDLRRGIDPAESRRISLPGLSSPIPTRRRTPAAPLTSPPEALAGLFPEVREGSLGEVLALWLDAARDGKGGCRVLAPRTLANYISASRTHLQGLAKLPAGNVSPDMIEDLFRGLKAKAPQMIRFVKKIISGGYEFAREFMPQHRRLTNPTRGIRVTVPKGRREERLRDDKEITAFLRGLDSLSDPLARDVFLLALASGCRPGEAAGVRAEDIIKIGGEKRWSVYNKMRREFHIPLTGPIGEIIERRFQDVNGVGPLFWGIDRTIGYPSQLRKATREIKKLGAVRKVFRPNDLRHTVRSEMSALGIREEVAEKLLNHESQKEIVQVYNHHQYWRERLQALEIWHAKLRKLGEEETKEAA